MITRREYLKLSLAAGAARAQLRMSQEPLAQDRRTAVMVYLPFGRTRLWNRVRGRDLPEWAAESGAYTWWR